MFSQATNLAGFKGRSFMLSFLSSPARTEWFAAVGCIKTHVVNMKGIQQHRSKYRVQKRVNGELRRWTYDTLAEAAKKRDTIFSKVAAGW